MPVNRQIELARAYHAGTAHSPRSVRAEGHVLDWEIKPAPFKIYPDLPAVPLPRDLPALEIDTLAALAGAAGDPCPLDLDRLASLLFFSAGVTRRKAYPGGGEMYFRAAPSTGALYQTEVYVVAGAVAGLAPGVYHFCPGDFALRRLREGDFRGAMAVAAADDGVGRAPATLVLTGLYWRNAWKYGARAYRHLFWDSGTMLANALAAAAALGLGARTVMGFVDREIHGLLGLDPGKEAALVLLPVGPEGASAGPPPVVVPLQHRVVPLSSSEVEYPAVQAAHADSCLASAAEVIEWRESPAPPPASGAEPALPALPSPRGAAGRGLRATILARGSTREFSGEAISAEALSTALKHATRPWPGDAPSGLVDLYVNVHAVDGLGPGTYYYRRQAHALEPLREGDVRRDSAFLCLEQPLGGQSSATVFFLADLGAVLARFGNRGYRLGNLEAGLVGGRLYLAAYAQRFGATGLTFYDDAVVAFLSPHAAGKDAIFVTALGRPVARPRQ
ncbi:MAG: SagB family peptide dehydrogenase [Candidatus Rokubacteria bacterium]|nr:SagB family peptide dehydrogenase [Candidatus Rokubacteria bacterium]